jgi:hypothetical protein
MQRMSWTTKTRRALICETIADADLKARVMLGHKRALMAHYVWSNSEHGYVIFNEAGTKMIADR